jgi:hypothetical protein
MSNKKLFVPGNNGMGGGRPKGSRDRLQKSFLYALADDFEREGAGVIRIARIEKPVEYLKIIASVLPKELIVEAGVIGDLSDEELDRHISLLQRMQAQAVATAEGRESDDTKH